MELKVNKVYDIHRRNWKGNSHAMIRSDERTTAHVVNRGNVKQNHKNILMTKYPLGEYMFTEEEKVIKIWLAKPIDFNAWRRENDLKLFFNYIVKHSNNFNKWMNYYSISLNDILHITPSRNCFWGSGERLLEYEDTLKNTIINITNKNANFGDEIAIKRDQDYLPYFEWKKIYSAKEVFLVNSKGKEYNDITFVNSGSFEQRRISVSSVEINSINLLFGELKLLDLGNVRLASDFGLLQKNLDFLSLDNITLYDSGNLWYSSLDICCSSIKNLRLENTTAQFFKFYKCKCSRLQILNSIITDLSIEESFMDDMLYSLFIDRSKVDKFVIKSTDLKNINIYDSELTNFEFVPEYPKGKLKLTSKRYEEIYKNVRRLRLSFEVAGNSYDASRFYYWERNLERKCFWARYNAIKPQSHYGGSYWRIVKGLLKREYALRRSMKYFKWKNDYTMKLITHKKFRNEILMLIFNQLRLGFEWLLWGYIMIPRI